MKNLISTVYVTAHSFLHSADSYWLKAVAVGVVASVSSAVDVRTIAPIVAAVVAILIIVTVIIIVVIVVVV